MTSEDLYRYSTVLEGHSSDVRCLAVVRNAECVSADYALVSGSRDHTARLWTPDPATKNRKWVENRTFTGHEKFVTSIAVKEPDSSHPQVKNR